MSSESEQKHITAMSLNAQGYYKYLLTRAGASLLDKINLNSGHPRLKVPNAEWTSNMLNSLPSTSNSKPDIIAMQETPPELALDILIALGPDYSVALPGQTTSEIPYGEIRPNLNNRKQRRSVVRDLQSNSRFNGSTVSSPTSPELMFTFFNRSKFNLITSQCFAETKFQDNLGIQCHGNTSVRLQDKHTQKWFDVRNIHLPAGLRYTERLSMLHGIRHNMPIPEKTVLLGDSNCFLPFEVSERKKILTEMQLINHAEGHVTYDLDRYDGWRMPLKAFMILMNLVGKNITFSFDIFATGNQINLVNNLHILLSSQPNISDHRALIGQFEIN